MWLRILTGELAGQKFELKQGDNIVGRAPDCDIVLNANGISKKHACIHLEGDKITVSDLRSSNGTYVNGIRIIKKELKSSTDKVSIHNIMADFKSQTQTRVGTMGSSQRPRESTQFQPPQYSPPFSQGANAMDQGPQMSIVPPEPVTAQQNSYSAWERFQLYIDDVAMPGVYKLAEVFEFRMVIGSMILGFVILMTVFSILPMMKITKDSVESESRRRALTIARNLAAINQSLLQRGVETAVTTRSAEVEEGVVVALIISNRDGHVIAPTTNLGEYPDQPFVHKARKDNREMVEQIRDDLIGAAVPMMVYSPETGQQVVLAHAVVLYDMGSLAINTERYISLFAQILIISLVLGFVLYFFVVKLAEEPLRQMSLQLEDALKDESKNLTSKFQLPLLKTLITNINSLLQRTGHSSGQQSFQNIDYHTEAGNIVRVMSNPAAVIDRDRLFLTVNSAFEDLVGMRLLTLQGQSLELLQDQALKMSVLDLLDQSAQSPGLIVSNQLDFSGIPYEVDLQAIQGPTAIAYFLLTLKKQEGNG